MKWGCEASRSMGKRFIREGRFAPRRMQLSRIPRALGRALLAWIRGRSYFEVLTAIVSIAVVALLGVIAVVLFIVAEPSIRTFGIGFLGGTVWDPVAGIFCAAPFLYRTPGASGVALLLGGPTRLGIATFLS